MPSLTGKYLHIPIETRAVMLADALACRAAILKAHQSGTHSGNSFSRAQLSEVTADIAELSYAATLLGESGVAAPVRFVHADMSHGP